MVTISGLLRFIQETRSNNAAEKLKAMVHTTATVSREEKVKRKFLLQRLYLVILFICQREI